jgi:hypothetical protein
MNNSNFGFLFWIHLILIIIAYLSPVLFNYWIVLIGVIFLFLQTAIFKGCLLTHAQFGFDKDMTIYYHYLKLLGFNPDKKRLKFIMSRIMPLIVLLIALILQLVFRFKPLIF